MFLFHSLKYYFLNKSIVYLKYLIWGQTLRLVVAFIDSLAEIYAYDLSSYYVI